MAAGRGGSPGVLKGLLPGRGAAGGRGGIVGIPAAAGCSNPEEAGAVSATISAGASTGSGAAFGLALGFAGAAAGAADGNAARTFRSTGASTVDEADRTNSPLSFNHATRALLSRPRSLASS
jgi:hypothetical protein